MSVRIQFDQPDNYCYTNLDYVSGRATLILPQDATISAITVKLEAESRSRLSAPKHPLNERSDKKRTELEVHKLLYKVLTVFPTPELQGSAPSQYTLLAGQYVYPFKFKFPFNNDCSVNTSMLKDLKMGQLNVQFAPDMNQHVKKTLPPSLSGFPGEAEIKYYVKATVVRPKFYQENFRSEMPIKFLPIEAPRPTDKQEETFARRKQQFQKYPGQPQRKGSLFKKSSESEKPEPEPPTFQVDARLPNPAILTCNEPLPLRVLVQKLGDTEADVYLSIFQIELIGYTYVRAHDLNRTESGSWVLKSLANMNMPLNMPNRKSQTEFKVPSHLWDNIPIPNTVAPSFETCNISRKYELEIRVGLSHSMAGSARPEQIVLPLRIPVEVWSGIAPPPELLRAMQERADNGEKQSGAFSNEKPPQRTGAMAQATDPSPTTPLYDHSQAPAPVGTSQPPNTEDFPDHAPPSYEDAMAEDFTPVDGPRRNYSVPEGDQQSPAFNSDAKGGGLGRRVSERLFSSNAPSGPRRTATSEASPIQEEQASYTEENPPPLPQRTSTTEKS